MTFLTGRLKLARLMASVALAACSAPNPSLPASVSTATTASGVIPPDGPSAPSKAAFDVHEWGLVDVQSSGAAALAAGPARGRTNWNAPRRKPVLYFHLAQATPAIDATVTVTTKAMGFIEHFPKGQLSSDALTLTWRDLHVRKESCHVVGAPTRESPECRTSDGQCEAAELATYETADASCIEVAGASYNHLFYRANGPPPPLPFEVVVKGNQLSMTHVRASDVVGFILYVHNDSGSVTVTMVAPPALGQSIAMGPPQGTDIAAAQRSLDSTMKEVGLTDAETAAFDRAWQNDLFGGDAARDAPSRGATAGPEDYLLFAMPGSLLNGASTVTITPAPRALHRFMLVRLRV